MLNDEENEEFSWSDIVQQANVTSGDDIETDDTGTPKVFMSVVHWNGCLGVAYYNVETTVLYMMPDITETENYDLLRRVFQQVQPSCVVVSTKQDDDMLKVLHEAAASCGLDPDKHIEVLPSIDFALDVCKRRIMFVNLPCMQPDLTEPDRLMFMSSLVPLHNVNMVKAAGALIKFMEKQRIGVELEDKGTRVPILTVRLFTLDNLLLIDENSYSALQIFKLESHPSGFKSETGREGFSLFGVLNRCKSKAGSQLMRMWFRHPLRNISMINERLDSIEFFMNPQNIEVTSSLHNCLKSVRNLGKVMGRMMQAQASLGDWQALYKTVYNAIFIGDLCRSQPQQIAIFRKIRHVFNENLHRIANHICKIVDFEESAVCNRFVVKPQFDKNLDEKKKTYNSLPVIMTEVAQEEIKNLSGDFEECHVVYLPQLGYLLAIPITDRMRQSQDLNLPGMQFVFSSDNLLHYKTASTREIDVRLGDTQCDIMGQRLIVRIRALFNHNLAKSYSFNDAETNIMHRLQDFILQQADLLLDVHNYAAELDCLIALANCARENGYCRPELTTTNTIVIRGGRHPLQELRCSPFVPNNTVSDESIGRMKLLTGTNASGKSVYLKQVGLIVFMAHVGSFVPADAATIGILDKIFTRIHTLESVTLNLSSFMIDLSQVSAAIRYATERSIIIVDEFGKGTESYKANGSQFISLLDNTTTLMVRRVFGLGNVSKYLKYLVSSHDEDGAALLCACLKFWMARGNQCPHTFVSTHYHSIIQHSLLPENPQLHFQTMDVIEDNGELIFLYQLVDGITSTSLALQTGMQAGLPQEVLDRATEVQKLRHKNVPIPRINGASALAELKQCEVIVRKAMKLDLENDDIVEFLNCCLTFQSKNRCKPS